MSHSIPVTLIHGHTIMIDPKSAEVGGCWQGRNEAGLPCVWDPSVLEVAFEILARSGENPFFIDIGANTGYCALLPALDHQMKGLAFEPNLEICSLLQKNIAMNGLEQNVQIMPLALGERPGTAMLKIPASGVDSGLACMGNAPTRFSDWQEVSVPVDTLDRVLLRKKMPQINLIKIDTEGAELSVLRGGIEAIKKYKPFIICEYWAPNTAQFGYHPDAITSFMTTLGYVPHKLGKEDMLFIYNDDTIL